MEGWVDLVSGYTPRAHLGRSGAFQTFLVSPVGESSTYRFLRLLDESAPAKESSRFLERSERLARLRHPDLLRVIDARVEHGFTYAVFEHVHGV